MEDEKPTRMEANKLIKGAYCFIVSTNVPP